jgi:predicted DsbA family dithiol-disulfide isomerase
LTLEELEKQYQGQLRVVLKHFVVHPDTALIPALASCAAGQQGKAWEFIDKVWEASWDTTQGARPKPPGFQETLSQANMEKIAKDLGLDVDKLKTAMKSGECQQQAQAGAQLQRVGATGTPTLYVNGRFVGGAAPLGQFKQLVDEEMKKADEIIQKEGIKPEDYYQKVVVERGKKAIGS